MPYDYTGWRELTPNDPPSGEFYIPANGNRICQLKSRPIYWLPIKGGMKCEE